MIGARAASAEIGNARRRRLMTITIVEALLLFLAAIAAVRLALGSTGSTRAAYTVIALTAIAMGLRNAIVRQFALPDITTTVLTLTLTGLAADSIFAGGNNLRLARRISSVVLMFAGAAVGAILVR